MADVVSFSQLGLCEHCQALLTMPSVLAISSKGPWQCPTCHKIITLRSFGHRKDGTALKKIFWVNQSGQWTTIVPEKDFKIGPWSAMKHPIYV